MMIRKKEASTIVAEWAPTQYIPVSTIHDFTLFCAVCLGRGIVRLVFFFFFQSLFDGIDNSLSEES